MAEIEKYNYKKNTYEKFMLCFSCINLALM